MSKEKLKPCPSNKPLPTCEKGHIYNTAGQCILCGKWEVLIDKLKGGEG